MAQFPTAADMNSFDAKFYSTATLTKTLWCFELNAVGGPQTHTVTLMAWLKTEEYNTAAGVSNACKNPRVLHYSVHTSVWCLWIELRVALWNISTLYMLYKLMHLNKSDCCSVFFITSRKLVTQTSFFCQKSFHSDRLFEELGFVVSTFSSRGRSWDE